MYRQQQKGFNLIESAIVLGHTTGLIIQAPCNINNLGLA